MSNLRETLRYDFVLSDGLPTSYGGYLLDRIEKHENAGLADKGETDTAKPYPDPTPSGERLAIGFGYDLTSRAGNTASIIADLQAAGVNLTTTQSQALSTWAAVVRNVASTEDMRRSANADLITAWDGVMTKGQAVDLVQNVVEVKEAELRAKLVSNLGQATADLYLSTTHKSVEQAVLVELAYQSSNLVGPKLMAALQAGDRAAAWFEIRFDSNKDRSSGIDTRRTEQAQQFGLFESGRETPRTLEEATALTRVLATNRDQISSYIQALPSTAATTATTQIDGIISSMQQVLSANGLHASLGNETAASLAQALLH